MLIGLKGSSWLAIGFIWNCSLSDRSQWLFAVMPNLLLSFFGPYQVIQKVGPIAYKPALPASSKIHPVFHVSLLKKKLGMGAVVQTSLPFVDDQGHLQLEPLAVLDRRLVKRNNRPHTQVLVQWANSIPEDAMWESWFNLHQCFPHFQPWGQGSSEEGGNDKTLGPWGKGVFL